MNTPETMRIYGVVTDSIVDGPGYRTAIFTQGCPHHCPGCHNPESHDPDGGTEWTLEAVEAKFTGNPLLDGITLTGGEPFEQPAACVELACRAHEKGLNVWTFSGYLYENLLEMAAIDHRICSEPPKTFREAVQAFFMQHIVVMRENPFGGINL